MIGKGQPPSHVSHYVWTQSDKVSHKCIESTIKNKHPLSDICSRSKDSNCLIVSFQPMSFLYRMSIINSDCLVVLDYVSHNLMLSALHPKMLLNICALLCQLSPEDIPPLTDVTEYLICTPEDTSNLQNIHIHFQIAII